MKHVADVGAPSQGGMVSRLFPSMAIILVQLLAAGFFIADAIADRADPGPTGGEALLEMLVALALLGGVVLGGAHIAGQAREIRRRAQAVAIARGALAKILADRFAEWRLSGSEADVALFALKGCTVAEIAEMRSAASGTVRAQLSQVYAKAGVSSQTMLMSLFLDDLLAGEPLAAV